MVLVLLRVFQPISLWTISSTFSEPPVRSRKVLAGGGGGEGGGGGGGGDRGTSWGVPAMGGSSSSSSDEHVKVEGEVEGRVESSDDRVE